MAKLFVDRIKNDNDNHVAIEGGTGCGKSNFTFFLVHCIHYLLHTNFDMEKQTLFIPSGDEMNKKMANLRQGDVYWMDEAIRALDKKQWYKIDQIEMNQNVKTERWRNNTILYNIQRFIELNESFRNDNIQFRIYIIPRFAAILFVKDIDKDVEDPWHRRENLHIKFGNRKGSIRYTAIKTDEERLKGEIRCPNYFMHEFFPNVKAFPELIEYWDYYNWLKKESRVQKKEKEEAKIEKETLKKANGGRDQTPLIKGILTVAVKNGIPFRDWYAMYKDDVNISMKTLQSYHSAIKRQHLVDEAIKIDPSKQNAILMNQPTTIPLVDVTPPTKEGNDEPV